MEILLTHDVHAGGDVGVSSRTDMTSCVITSLTFTALGERSQRRLCCKVSLGNNPRELGLIIGDDECSDIARYHLFYCFINAAFCVD